MKHRYATRFVALLMMAFAAAGLFAQTATGNVYGKVVDESGAVLPGASVTISGEAGSRTSVTGSDGTFRFLNLDPREYTVTVSLQGFGSANRRITVQTGLSATLDLALKVGGQAETVEVVAVSPLVDLKKRGTSANLTTQDLLDTPNSRDPWGIMNQVAGALVDRVNIAGNENGQQASVAGKGSYAGDRVWSLDGLVITDMASTGASPAYFDFDAFQEINVSTGGGDLTMQTGGFGMNLVTKRGTNTFHGGGRYLVTDSKWQSSNLPDSLRSDPRLRGGVGHCQAEGGANAFREYGDSIDSIKDFGFDLGGPIVKDKLWFYGTYGKQDIKNCRFAGTFDDTLLPSYNFKLNWQAATSTMVSAFYFLGSKEKFGRGVGFPVTETDDFLWNQGDAFTEGGLPGGLWKLEVNHTFSPNFFVSAKGAYYDAGFGLFARGGADKTYTIDYASSQALGSYVDYTAIRPQTTLNVDGSYFASSMGGNHELKFGFGYRESTTSSISHYNGNQLNGEYYGPGTGGGNNVAYATRDVNVKYSGKYASLYLGDVFTKDRLTLNVGVRVDTQSARNLASESPANASFPARIPARAYEGSDTLIDFTDISPRVGFSYALDEARKTVLRASLARYGAQFAYANVTTENPLGATFVAYSWNDLNADKFPQANEVGSAPLFASGGFDPSNPSAARGSSSKIDKDLKNRYDNEAILGLDRELGSNFAVGAAVTYRRTSGFQATPRLAAPCPTGVGCVTMGPGDYVANAPVSATRGGVTYTTRTFSPSTALIAAGGSGRFRTNRDGYTNTFKGLELTMNKRMSNRWGARLAFSLNDWTESFDGVPTAANGNPGPTDIDPLKSGGPVSVLSGGSGKAAFYSSYIWQVYANAIVRLPGAFDFSTQIFGRQGGTFPVNITTSAGSDGATVRALVGNVDDRRYDNLWNIDFRLARASKISRVTLTPSLELFNALNNDVVLSRARNAGAASFNRIEELISPRIARIGVRLAF